MLVSKMLQMLRHQPLIIVTNTFRLQHPSLTSMEPIFMSGNISSKFSGLYASSREKCCGGKVISERKGCCGTGPKAVEYDPRFMGCCKTRTWAQSYDPSGEICCGNRVIDKDGKVSHQFSLKKIFQMSTFYFKTF